jgi:cardiolipin synthase
VAVTVVLDGFGATVGEQFFAPLVAAGGCFCCFQPRWNVRYLIRNHQKIAVADERRAMLGGFNVADAYFAPSTDPRGWTDLAFTVEGPVVGRITGWFDALARWSRNPHARFRAIRKLVREWAVGPGPVQLLIGGPTTGLSSWARHVGQDLRQAHRLDMMMAYFSPPPRLQKHIRAIARTGSARLVMPALSDNAATVGAARALYARLLDAGAQVWEFEAARMHTKLIVLDDRTYIGSANFDMRSLYLNLEIVLCIRDAALAERMRALIGDYLPACTHITPALHHARRGWWNRLRWRASWFLVSVVDYTVSRRLNLGL